MRIEADSDAAVRERRLGEFTVPDRQWLGEEGRVMRRGIIPIRIEYKWHCNGFEVVAFGPMFEPLPEGAHVTRYIAIFEQVRSVDGLTVEFRGFKREGA